MDSPDMDRAPGSRSLNPYFPQIQRQHDPCIFPRLIDLGQCNDAIVAVEIAQALAGLFGALA